MYQIITYILVIVFIRQCSISIEDLSGITHAFPSIKTSIALKWWNILHMSITRGVQGDLDQ